MQKSIYLDCDGTWIDLYGVDNWLSDLINHNTRPYEVAKPMVNLAQFAKLIHKAQRKGYKVGIISWLAKNSTEEYDKQVTKAKQEWLKKHLPSVNFDSISIIPYGTPKSKYGKGILFDDEYQNRKEWESAKGIAYSEKELITFFQAIQFLTAHLGRVYRQKKIFQIIKKST